MFLTQARCIRNSMEKFEYHGIQDRQVIDVMMVTLCKCSFAVVDNQCILQLNYP